MKTNVSLTTARSLLAAGLVLAASAAFAAPGFTLMQTQEAQITAGMSRADVRTALGRPAHNVKFMADPGRTWTYGVVGANVPENTVFDVDFSADGRVLQAAERVEPMTK
jgi:outer membrane protein assembly factor BamE (lipoprotein component of BamABCDE complex)